MAHLDSLCAFGLEEELWKWTPNRVVTRAAMEDYVNTALRGQHDGTMLPFAILGAPDLKRLDARVFAPSITPIGALRSGGRGSDGDGSAAASTRKQNS